jgi:arginine exporter protein ArgO
MSGYHIIPLRIYIDLLSVYAKIILMGKQNLKIIIGGITVQKKFQLLFLCVFFLLIFKCFGITPVSATTLYEYNACSRVLELHTPHDGYVLL